MERKEVYRAIDGERDYQEAKWPAARSQKSTPTEFAVYMRDYLEEGLHAVSRSAGWDTLLHAIRKVTALGVAAGEAFGMPSREYPNTLKYNPVDLTHRFAKIARERRAAFEIPSLTKEFIPSDPSNREYIVVTHDPDPEAEQFVTVKMSLAAWKRHREAFYAAGTSCESTLLKTPEDDIRDRLSHLVQQLIHIDGQIANARENGVKEFDLQLVDLKARRDHVEREVGCQEAGRDPLSDNYSTVLGGGVETL